MDWVGEKISYLDRIHQLHQKTVSSTASMDGFKLQIGMSVPQLSYLLRLLVETKLGQNKNVAEVFRFFVRFFRPNGWRTLP